ncbi:DUF1624 domain-containing protein [Rhizobium sp. P32RR-XVIII]|uniref:heparan-alpha-glucosaminide N-acetyltransferase n=1 Tax=Rhizobium sp. P32RR-XVIII TaxID=2726738 RepID=UPI001457606C|nr:heparan-alpha-glucosaminide N-acetyltransferase [Rhizobium sp. P32RR-XVIII]NLS05242.1 DUF1624 domain-containing protein [Rhizobium sp. P32RR-XVIII]
MAISASENEASVRVPRIGLLDTARGVALVAMATYHFSWDLEAMGYLAPGTVETGWLKIYARVIASTFLFIAGISMALSSKPEVRWPSFWRRFAMIAGAALAISVVTRFIFPGEWIFFGILHCIAVLSLLGLVFLRLPLPVTIAATAVITAAWVVDTWIAPNLLRSPVFNPRYLAWMGFAEMPQRSNDYVPIFPWAVPFMLGAMATLLAMRTGLFDRLAKFGTGSTLLARAGRHSLAFYLIHQPVLFSIAYGLTMVIPPAVPDLGEIHMKQCNPAWCDGMDATSCQTYCQCTLTELQQQNLLVPFHSGAVKPEDERIQSIANQCSIKALPAQQP